MRVLTSALVAIVLASGCASTPAGQAGQVSAVGGGFIAAGSMATIGTVASFAVAVEVSQYSGRPSCIGTCPPTAAQKELIASAWWQTAAISAVTAAAFGVGGGLLWWGGTLDDEAHAPVKRRGKRRP